MAAREWSMVGETAHGFKAGQGLVPICWSSVHDQIGTHCEEFFDTTDVVLTASEIIDYYRKRWNIETTLQGMHLHLGLETTRGHCAETVSRAAPCLACTVDYRVCAGTVLNYRVSPLFHTCFCKGLQKCL